MSGVNLTLPIWTILVLILAGSSVTVYGSSECEQKLANHTQKCTEYQTRTLETLKEISDGDQLCAPPTRLENQLKKERAVHVRQKGLITAISKALASRKQQATVPHVAVYGKVNGSVEFSCELENQPLSLCVWETAANRHGKTIIVDQQVIKNGGATSVDGIYTTTDGLENGKCVLKIQRLKKEDIGSWSCTLVTQSGTAYGECVEIYENDPPSIYFATGQGVKRYSLGTGVVETVADSSESFVGVAFDWLRDKVYWSSDDKVFRANRDGTKVETVLHTTEYGILVGLALDWVSGNIYIASYSGFILACNGGPTWSFACAEVLTGQGNLQGIALDPVAGTMYWTKYAPWSDSRSSILRSELDGTNPVTLVTNLENPWGIAIDFSSQRLYWANAGAHKIQSSDLQGQDGQTVFQRWDDDLFLPNGVAVVGSRIFWSTFGSHKLQSGSKKGGHIITHYNGTTYLRHLAVVPSTDLPQNRTNHCEGHSTAAERFASSPPLPLAVWIKQ